MLGSFNVVSKLVGPVAVLALTATACGGGPGSQEDFVDVLMRDGTGLSEDEATCIGGRVFDEYGEDDDALGKLSAAPDMDFLEGEDGIPGFGEFFDEAVQSCLQIGPGN